MSSSEDNECDELTLTPPEIQEAARVAVDKKERRASLVVLPPLVLGYDDLYDDSRQVKITKLKGQITEEQQRLINHENKQYNHIKRFGQLNDHVKSEVHGHDRAKSEGHGHDHAKSEEHVHDHDKSEEHGHDHAKSEGHVHDHVKSEEHGHDHAKNEGHVHDHVKSDEHGHDHAKSGGHGHDHVKSDGHIHKHANSLGHVGDSVKSNSVIHTKSNENKFDNSQDNSFLDDASRSSENFKHYRKGGIIELDIKKDGDGQNLQFAGKFILPANLFRCPCQKHEQEHQNERIGGRRY